jgi:2-oxoglutarate ferredoxin oxidoreductase subunit gamma
METSIILSGFGGQGALFAGQLVAYAAMDNGYHVTWFPSYGPEMRGGTAHCTVMISDEPVGAPVVARPEIALVFNGPSFEKYEPLVMPGGLLVVNSSICSLQSTREDMETVYVPANSIAEEYGSSKMMNMAVLGAMIAQRSILSLEAVEQSLKDHLPANKANLLDNNLRVLHKGYEIGLGIPV